MGHDYSKGMHWVGHPGSLHPIIDYGSESSSHDIETKVNTSMSGRRRVRVSRQRPARSWTLSIPEAHADQTEPVETLLTATLPPYVLVTAKAQVSNVLTPERAAMLDSDPMLGMAGAWPLEGGGWSTLTRTNPAANFDQLALVRVGPAPVPPAWTGRKVTASVWLGGSGTQSRAILDWLDAAGNQIGSGVQSAGVTGMDVLRRASVTATPPPGAVACRIGIIYAAVIAQPQVTWTDHAIPEWSSGKGADRVVITGFGDGTRLAVPDDYNLRRSDYDINLMELD